MSRDSSRTYCDGLGCTESHPTEHEDEGTPGFVGGRWAGWLYLDLNRPDLSRRSLRFCDLYCLTGWVQSQPSYMRLPAPDPGAWASLPADEMGIRRTKGLR